MGDLIYLTGPVRSGKSRRAVEVARDWGEAVVFVATYRLDPTDAEMADRVRRHQAERPTAWRVLEAPPELGDALEKIVPAPHGAIVDSLGLWLADRFDRTDDDILTSWSRELDRFRAAPYPVIVVADEIGWSPVPIEASLRRFRDLAGFLGQSTAARATEAWLMVAGCGLRLK